MASQTHCLEFDCPGQIQSAVDRIVIERWPVLDLIVEAHTRELVELAKISQVESSHIVPFDRIAVELIVSRVDVVFFRETISAPSRGPFSKRIHFSDVNITPNGFWCLLLCFF